MTFASRADAGERLGRHLAGLQLRADLVLGLPRGGVIVAAEVARILERPLGVIVVRKIGHPRHREFAVGALAEPDVVILDQEAIEQTGVREEELGKVIEEETLRLSAFAAKFHPAGRPQLHGAWVLIVDDGLATGATAEAAVLSARRLEAERVHLAVPVSSASAFERLGRTADQVFALAVDPDFGAVGGYYQSFPQTGDDEVLALLQARG